MDCFALKVFYNRIPEVQLMIEREGCLVYVPMTKVEKTVKGKIKEEEKPIVNGLMFVYATLNQAVNLQSVLRDKAMFYVNRETRMPSVIPEREMTLFRTVVDTMAKGLEFVDAGAVNYRLGQHVRVIDGDFKGTEGYIKRIHGNRRLVVAIEGVVAVITMYIPQAHLEAIED